MHRGRSLRGLAHKITANSFATIHDGGSVRHQVLAGALLSGNDGGLTREPSRQIHMPRSNTSLFLGELLTATQEASVRGGAMGNGACGSDRLHGMHRSKTATGELTQLGSQPSGLQLLAASVKQYIDVSVHGGRTSSRDDSRRGSQGGSMTISSRNTSGQTSPVQESVTLPSNGELLKVLQVRRGSMDDGRSLPGSGNSVPPARTSEARRVHSIQPLSR